MNFKVQAIIYFSYLYGFFEIFMSVRQQLKHKKAIVKTGDKWSVWVLIACITVGYSLSFSIGFTHIGRIYLWNIFFGVGATLALLGLMIRIISILTLRRHFTYTVTKIDHHELIDTGLYKNIRHPGYLGQLIIFLGVSTSLSNWLAILCMMVPVLIGYYYRIRIEEKFLVEHMGQEYLNYQKRTKKLIPMIY